MKNLLVVFVFVASPPPLHSAFLWIAKKQLKIWHFTFHHNHPHHHHHCFWFWCIWLEKFFSLCWKVGEQLSNTDFKNDNAAIFFGWKLLLDIKFQPTRKVINEALSFWPKKVSGYFQWRHQTLKFLRSGNTSTKS